MPAKRGRKRHQGGILEVIKTLAPGRPGTHRYQRQYGDRLVTVRYRHDPRTRRRLTTVELIVDEAPFALRSEREKTISPHPNRHVYVRVRFEEQELRQQVKAAGGRWIKDVKLWQLPHTTAVRLGLKHRIQER